MMQAGLLGVSLQTDAQGQAEYQSFLGQSSGWSVRRHVIHAVCLFSNFCRLVSCHTRPGAGLTQAQLSVSQSAHALRSSFLLGGGGKKGPDTCFYYYNCKMLNVVLNDVQMFTPYQDRLSADHCKTR